MYGTSILVKLFAQLMLVLSVGVWYATLMAVDANAQTLNSITVGVISPKDGSTSVLQGESHEESIRLAFNNLGPLQVGDLLVKLELSAWNDGGMAEAAAEGALKLARDEQVVAILGPVNSGSTLAVLKRLKDEEIELPVISSLSTAPELTQSKQRSKNFFRLIFDDAGRMGQYATFIKREKAKEGEQTYLFLYEKSPYGEGLMRSLKDRFYTPNIKTMSWCEISKNGGNDCIMGAIHYEALRNGQSFRKDFLELIDESNINNIILLGDTAGSLALVDGLEAKNLNLRADYFFVGSSKRLFDEAPSGSLTIGDPVLDYLRAPTAGLSKEWDKLLSDFEELAKKDRADFVMTAYEAAMVLHSALRMVLSSQQTLPEISDLRRKLLLTLESETFNSLEPWRTINFDQGKLSQPPTAPIYRITRGVAREDEISDHPWVDISVKQRNALFESPVQVHRKRPAPPSNNF